VILELSTCADIERDGDRPFKLDESIPLTTDVIIGIKREILSRRMPVNSCDTSITSAKGTSWKVYRDFATSNLCKSGRPPNRCGICAEDRRPLCPSQERDLDDQCLTRGRGVGERKQKYKLNSYLNLGTGVFGNPVEEMDVRIHHNPIKFRKRLRL